MFGGIFKILLMLAPVFLPRVLGWFGIKLNETDLQVGERLGQAETIAAGSARELNDAQKAVDAARAAGVVDDAGGVRDAHSGDRPWNPDTLG